MQIDKPDKVEIIITKTERPNSVQFRWGGTGTDVKIYFNEEQDLITQLVKLNQASFEIATQIIAFKEKMKGAENGNK